MPATLAQIAIALLMALVLCMGLTPPRSLGGRSGGDRWLQRAAGRRAAYRYPHHRERLRLLRPERPREQGLLLHGGQTLADLFAAAKAAGDIKDYEFSNPYGYGEYLASVMMPDDTVVSDPTGAASYWANFKNGSYASGAACQAGDKLAAGDAFQFAFTDLVVNRGPLPTSGLS